MFLRMKTADGAERLVEHPSHLPLPEFIDLPLNRGHQAPRSLGPDEVTAPLAMRRYRSAGRNAGVPEYVEVLP